MSEDGIRLRAGLSDYWVCVTPKGLKLVSPKQSSTVFGGLETAIKYAVEAIETFQCAITLEHSDNGNVIRKMAYVSVKR